MTHSTMNSALVKAIRVARVLRVAVVLLILALAAGQAWLWVDGRDAATGWVQVHAWWSADAGVHPRVALLASTAGLLVLLYGLLRLTRMLRRFEAGDFFGIDSVRHLRAFALTLLLSTLLDVLLAPLLLLGLRLAGSGDVHGIVLAFDAGDAWMLLVGTLFFLITWILAEARRAAEDSAQIV